MVLVFCANDKCDNDPNEYMLCARWRNEHPVCRGDMTVNYASWRESQGKENGNG